MKQLTANQSVARFSVAVAALALLSVALGGLVHGRLSHRWGEPADLVAAAELLNDFPEQFGDWRLATKESMDDSVVETLQCAGYLSRAYTNSATAESVRVAVIVGPPGPTAVHTPEICYSSRTYNLEKRPESEKIGNEQDGDTFWSVKFRSKEAGGGELNVYYAWASDGVWRASESPRYEYGGLPFLYKIQVAGAPSPFGVRQEEDLCKRFLQDLLRSGWRVGPKVGNEV